MFVEIGAWRAMEEGGVQHRICLIGGRDKYILGCSKI